MLRSIRTYTILITLALLGSFIGAANRVQAQTYQIDCAILLCLAGGWPASVPCARARAEFIRRITPWPIEPPLQIWRCPMGASYTPVTPPDNRGRLYEILFTYLDRPRPLSSPAAEPPPCENAIFDLVGPKPSLFAEGFALQLVQDRADIDISGPEFNFVRSIRVYDVRYARQHESGRDGDCNRFATIDQCSLIGGTMKETTASNGSTTDGLIFPYDMICTPTARIMIVSNSYPLPDSFKVGDALVNSMTFPVPSPYLQYYRTSSNGEG